MNVQHVSQDRSLRMPLLVRVFEGLGFYPNPDAPDGDWGPAGPYAHLIQELFRSRAAAVLGPHPEPWRFSEVFGPRPEPWRVGSGKLWNDVARSRSAAKSLVDLTYTANALGDEPARSFALRISEFVDDWCGTPPRLHIPLPGPGDPWPGGGDEPRPISPVALTMMGADLFRASRALGDSLLGNQLADAGERLAQTGLERLGQA
jgi:hypothetical protein